MITGWITLLLGCTAAGVGSRSHASGKASDTADTGASTAWEPGDPIPGWEDYDCPPPEGAGYAEVALSTPVYVGWGDATVGGSEGGGVAGFRFQAIMADCESLPCSFSGSTYSLWGNSWGEMVFEDLGGDLTGRGQGMFDTVSPTRSVSGSEGGVELLSWQYSGDRLTDDVLPSACVSRVRPDRISWVLDLRPRDNRHSSSDAVHGWYRDFTLRVRYDTSLADHAGCLIDLDDAYGCVAPEGTSQIGYYQVSYDDAWPWDSITDPDIRDAVYNRYTPWNSP